MNKVELIDAVAVATGLAKSESARAIDAVLESITTAIRLGEAVALPGFGTFTVKDRAPRTGRNPQTGATIQIPATRTAGFKPGKALKMR